MNGIRHTIEQFIYREVELLDDRRFAEWLSLFAPDGIYWLPIDEHSPRTDSASLIYDDAICREERVYRLEELTSPALSPKTRTLHIVSNIRIDQTENELQVRTNQVLHEIRDGDYRQAGLGELVTHVAAVHYSLREIDGNLRIALKKVLLINRDMPIGNLNFIL